MVDKSSACTYTTDNNTDVVVTIIIDNNRVVNTKMKGANFLPNRDIKLAAAGVGVRMWQIADELGILDCNLSRKLRHELPAEEKEKIFSIIKRLSAESTGGGASAG